MKESDFNIYILWPEGEEGRAQELFDYIIDEVGLRLCGEPHPEVCPIEWTAGGTLSREAGDSSYLKRSVYVDLDWLHAEYPDDERITQALELMKKVDEERNLGV